MAKISLNESLRSNINSNVEHLRDMVQLMRHTTHAITAKPTLSSQCVAVLIRISFTLGNLTASNDRNRELIGIKYDGANLTVQVLCLIQRMHTHARDRFAADNGEEKARDEDADDAGGSVRSREQVGDLEELLVKLIRLLANMSISGTVGPIIARTSGCENLTTLLTDSLAHEREDLMLNVVSAITNLSYYNIGQGDRSQGGPNLVLEAFRPVCDALVRVLLHENEEAVAEAARAFGNVSRDSEVGDEHDCCSLSVSLLLLSSSLSSSLLLLLPLCGVVPALLA